MSHRISTGMLYQQSLGSMQSKQATMARLQQQLASGKKLVTAKDDPVGAGAAVGMDRAIAALERFGQNGDAVRHRLNLQEGALAQAGEIVGRIQVLSVQAANGTLSDEDRQAIASEVRSLRDALFDIGNTGDGTGRFLFGGTTDGSPPFLRSSNGVGYNGDQTQRQVEVAPDMYVADAVPGSELFLRIRTGDGRLDAHSAAGNTGTGRVSGFSTTDAGAWAGPGFDITFDDSSTYRVTDSQGAVVATGTHAAGEAITFAGLSVTISGTPLGGDRFTVGPAGTRDVFSTIDNLLHALTTPAISAAQQAVRQEGLQASMRDLARANEHFIDMRAAGGAQLAALEHADELRSAFDVTARTTLSGLRDLDYAQAITQFNLEKVALDAAQLSFMQMQRSSLFNLLR